jgi:pyridoxal phosphate enzyme (YggS family)
MSQSADCYRTLLQEIETLALACGRDPKEITLVAVTKTHSAKKMHDVYAAGCHHFAESRMQEAMEKIPKFHANMEWHFIGSLQSNKINKALDYFQMIHSVDDMELLRKLSQVNQKRGKAARLLLQVNTSGEASKQGRSPQEWREWIEEADQLPFIQLEGLMTIAPLTEDKEVIRNCFAQLRQLRDEFKLKVKDPALFKHLSMGMSHDYPIAIEEGATLLRIGSAIFGER